MGGVSEVNIGGGLTWIKSLWLGLYPFFHPHKFDITCIVLLVLVESGLEVGIQAGIRYIIDEAILNHQLQFLLLLLSLAGLAALMVGIIAISRELLYSKLAAEIPGEIRAHIFQQIQGLPMQQLRRSKHGEFVTRIINDATSVEPALWAVGSSIVAMTSILFSSVALFLIEWRLTLTVLALLPLSLLSSHYLSPRSVQANYQTRYYLGRLATYCQENLLNQSILRVFNLGHYADTEFGKHNQKIIQQSRRFNTFSYLTERTPVIFVQLIQLLILGLGSIFIFDGLLTIGQFFAFYLLFGNLCRSWNELSMVIPKLIEASGGLLRIREVLSDLEVDPPIITQAFPGLHRGISLENIDFSYEGDRNQIDQVSFQIPPGEWIAIVGSSGSGKSTLLQILLGLEKPTRGAIIIGDSNLHNLSLTEYRSRISAVFQDSLLFNISIRDNICLGKLGASELDMIQAAQSAELDQWILTLPEGYDTIVSSDLCSGGQRQRLALARALIRNPDLLILDEPTSALDIATATSILKTLHKVTAGRTVVMATHQLHEAAIAHSIVVFDQGRVVEIGNHQELIARNGVYAELWSSCLDKSMLQHWEATEEDIVVDDFRIPKLG